MARKKSAKVKKGPCRHAHMIPCPMDARYIMCANSACTDPLRNKQRKPAPAAAHAAPAAPARRQKKAAQYEQGVLF